MKTITQYLQEFNLPITSREFSQKLDKLELSQQLQPYRKEYYLPKIKDIQPEGDNTPKELENGDSDVIYLVSNSLGLLNKRSEKLILEELEVWSKKGVFGHFQHDYSRPWAKIDEQSIPLMAKVVGAKPIETAIMCTLTSNLHFLLNAFYKPTTTRFKILMEDKAFPSDHYAIQTQIKHHNLNPDTDVIYIKPRDGEHLIRHEDIYKIIDEEGDQIALILFPGIQYYTGQVFPMEEITKRGHAKGCTVGFDLAHAVGNIPLELNQWNVDFACWCTYKYLASGPGNIGGIFVHEKFANKEELNRLIGWWAHNPKTRFQMSNQLDLSPGAAGFQMSNPSVTNVVALQGTLEIYDEVGMNSFRQQSLLLTGYLEALIKSNTNLSPKVEIMTSENPENRGCQLSLLLKGEVDLETVYKDLLRNGVMTDERYPNCIRVAPYPMINTFDEVRRFADILQNVLN